MTDTTRRTDVSDQVMDLMTRRLLAWSPLGLLIAVYYALWGPVDAGSPRWLAVVTNTAQFTAYFIILSVVTRRVGRRLLRRELAWADESREPSEQQRSKLARLPARVGSLTLVGLLVMAVGTAAGNLTFQRDPADSIRILVGLSLTAMLFAAVAYLVAEEALRPAFAIASAAEVATERAVGVRLRLVVAWAVGSGVPLFFLLAVPLGKGRGPELPVEVPVVMMALIGLLAGCATTLIVARSLADPIERVRTALDQVAVGRLDVEISVDDLGEVGLLQAGFNRMVVGLRERKQLEELFGRYVGEPVARRAVAAGVDLGGERCEVTVLFVDVVGSTALAEREPPERVVQVLNEVFARVVAIVSDESGWVDKFEGDAAMCVFGAPAPLDGHAEHALRAGRRLVDAMLELRGSGIDVGIGMASGEVVAGNVGAQDRVDYTVIGPPANVASRLSDLAKTSAGRVLAASATVQRAGAEADRWSPAGSVELRGVSVPIETFEPIRDG